MAAFREIQNSRVRQLAETLKKNGLAASESEAISMATSMTKTESRVSQHFEENRDGAVMNTGNKGSEGIALQSKSSLTPTSEKEMIQHAQTGTSTQTAQATQTNTTPKQQPTSTRIIEQTPQQARGENNTREKEELAQGTAQRGQPAPLHSNGAIAQAISTVQQSFDSSAEEKAEQSIDLGVAQQADTLAQTIVQEEVQNQEVQQEVQQEQQLEQETKSPQEEPSLVNKEEQTHTQEPVQSQEKTQSEQPGDNQNEIPQTTQDNSPEEIPIPPKSASREFIEPTSEQAPVQNLEPTVNVQEIQSADQATDKVVQTGFDRLVEEASQNSSNTEQQAMPSQTQTSENAPVQDENQPETTQEMKTQTPPAKDTSKMAESKINLSDVFNFNK